MKHFLLFCLLLMFEQTFAQEPNYICQSVDGNITWYYIDGSIKPFNSYSNPNTYKAWCKMIEKKPTVINKKVYANTYSLNLFLIDCQNNKSALLKSIIYSKDGTPLKEYEYEDESTATLRDCVPESLGAKIVKYICSLL